VTARGKRRQATRPSRRAIARIMWDLDKPRLALLLEVVRDLSRQQRVEDFGREVVRIPLSGAAAVAEVTGGRAA
jgi:hypothetical protein